MSKPWMMVVGALLVIGFAVAATDEPATSDDPPASANPPVETNRTLSPAADPITTPAPTGPAPAGPAPTAAPGKDDQLGSLRIVDRSPTGIRPYDRKAFGSRWADVDHNGCNQRDDVLLRDVQKGTVIVQRQGRCHHDVIAGTWLDPYTGKTLTFTDLKDPKQSVAIQIDHIVPLAEAWRSGASEWTDERRRQFANDLDNLLAVDGPTNQSKSAFDPASWRPRAAFQCTYAERWIGVKHRWNLAADTSEINALRQMLATC